LRFSCLPCHWAFVERRQSAAVALENGRCNAAALAVVEFQAGGADAARIVLAGHFVGELSAELGLGHELGPQFRALGANRRVPVAEGNDPFAVAPARS